MPKFHVKSDGNLGQCTATLRPCPLKEADGSPTPHGEFPNADAAKQFAEEVNAKRFDGTFGAVEQISGREVRRRAAWDKKLMKMRRLSTDSTPFNMKYFPQFTKHEDGSVTENGWDFNTEHSAESWNRKLAERRHPDAKHSFVGDSTPLFAPGTEGSAWPQRRTQCSNCGEVRIMSFHMDPTTVKDRWCTK